MAWIDIMNSGAAEKPDADNLNWTTEQEKLKRRRTMAQDLKKQALQDQQGQFMKSGDFTGFVGGNTLASTAARLVSAYLGTEADKKADTYSSEIDAASDAAFLKKAQELDEMMNPSAKTAAASTQGIKAVSQQPMSADPEPAQPLPVMSNGPVEGTPLPPVYDSVGGGRGRIVEAPGARAAAAAMPLENGGQRRGGTASELRRNAYVAGGGEPAPVGVTGSWEPDPKVAARAVAPMPAAPEAPPAASPLLPAMTPRPMEPTAPAAPMAQPTAEPAAPAPAAPMQAEVLAQLHSIAKTGPMGQQFANSMMQQMFGPKANGYEFKAVKQGDNEVLVAVNARNPRDTRVVWQGGEGSKSVAERRLEYDMGKDEREKTKGVDGALQSNDYAIRKIETLLPKVGDATGMGGKISNWFNKATGIPTDSAVATEELESIKGTLMAAAMRMSKEQAGSAAGLSQVESEALTKSIASLDPRIGEKALTEQLSEVRRQLLMYGERLKGGSSGGTPSEGKTKLDWR